MNQVPGEGYRKPIEKTEWIARTLREINPDIAMLCEVGGKESLDLLNTRYLKDDYHTALLPGNSDRGIEMGYLIHKRFPLTHSLLSHKDKVLNFNYPHEILEHRKNQTRLKTHRFSRDIAELRLTKDGEVKIIFLLVHLKSKLDKEGIDFGGELRRKAELHSLIETYNQRRAEFPRTPVIVAGDMNGQAQRQKPGPEFEALYHHTDLEDVLEVIKEPHDRRFSYFHFGQGNVKEGSQLDYILLPPELHSMVKKEESGIYQYRDPHGVLVNFPEDSFQRYALPSDHYPVVATFENLTF